MFVQVVQSRKGRHLASEAMYFWMMVKSAVLPEAFDQVWRYDRGSEFSFNRFRCAAEFPRFTALTKLKCATAKESGEDMTCPCLRPWGSPVISLAL